MPTRLLSVYASKGGVGKSFVAANLAVNLRLETREPTLLLDLGYPISLDAARALDMAKVNALENLLPTAAGLSPAIIKSFATPHPSGIDVLCLSTGNKDLGPELLTPGAMETVLFKLSGFYGWIVADIGLRYDPVAERILELSSLILLVLAPETLALQHAIADQTFLRQRNFAQNAVQLVLNQAGKPHGLDPSLVETGVRRELFGAIPFDPDIAANFSTGRTYPKDFPRHEVAKAFDTLTLNILRCAEPMLTPAGDPEPGETNDIFELKRAIHQRLLETFDLKHSDVDAEGDPRKREELEDEIKRQITEILDTQTSTRSRELRAVIVREVLQDVLGLGPLEDLLADESISEIMVNRWDRIFVEKSGRIELSERRFVSERHVMRVIERIVAPLGRKIDTSTPMVDARLRDGSRVNAIIPPLAIDGAVLTIRKFPKRRLGIEDLFRFETLSRQMAEFIQAAVSARLNVLISGGTGSGKTTLLNILSGFIPSGERIITVEDSAELQLQQPHVITLEARPPNIEGVGEVTIRDLVRNCLRMRPDRIVVGECRGPEALDMLQAMNTGHDGSLTTIHANSAREAVGRLETLVMFAGYELPSRAIKEQISAAIDLVVQIKRFKDGSRHVVQVAEITGMEGDVVTMGDVFEFREAGMTEDGRVKGAFVSTGYVPRCLKRFEERGISLPREIFWTAA